ncbi:HTH-type transcriptional regulator MalT [Hahella sp. KA22]|uniref:HTH-type transcriptional regulator MalT n=2 Tax=Hahella sp. KA22 TaxID=1628392 RepID=UPI000FDDBAFD|nr:HTH-type transcriptional regulator MalT [Hahella sp. KA22]AZZ90024.1 HTH-type transcriptional regulator MalT [Hahella sp. KA22]QAY53394.1 HTH-type transcriptional regulator MalT [Hahella sp. KA22]
MTTTIKPESLTLIKAKIMPPPRPARLLEREKFDDLLHEIDPVNLILVQAPAGYGKTTMIDDRLNALGANAAWFRLDAQDNLSEQFAFYVAHTLNEATRGACPETLRTLNQQGYPTLQTFLTDLLSELPLEGDPLLVVLDDYHLITNTEIHSGVTFLLRHLPPYITLVLLSRTTPPIGVAQLRMQGRMLEITAKDLSFSADEAQAYFEQRLRFEVSRESIERANRRVEGWVSALQLLAATASTGVEFNEYVEQLHSGNHYIFDYFDELTRTSIDNEQRLFLLRTSVLERFNALMVMRLAQQQDGQFLLNSLLNLGLFIVPLDSSGLWFRYHPLFAAYLRHMQACVLPDETARLHQRASDAWREMGFFEDAARHAVLAKDQQRIKDILLSCGRDFFTEGQFNLLQRCFDALNKEVIADHPILTLLRAWVAQGQYQWSEVESWLKAAEQHLKTHCSEEEWEAITGEFNAVRAQVAMNVGDAERAQTFAKSALAHDPVYLPTSRTAASSVIGESLFVQGHLKEAINRMQDTEQLALAEHAHQNVIWALCQQSEISVAQGYLQKAYNIQEKALQYAEDHSLERLPILEFLYRIRSQIMWEWHHLESAERCALKGIEILESQGERWFIQSYVMLAKIAQARGRQSLCADYVQKIHKMLASGEYHIDWTANAHAAMLSYWDAVRDKESIQRWLTAAPEPTPEQATNHFTQCNIRNWARAYVSLGDFDKALPLLEGIQSMAEQFGLKTDINRNHIHLSQLYWLNEQREEALRHMAIALKLASTTGAVGSFLRIGKVLINILKALISEEQLDEMEKQRAERLIQLAQQQRDFSRAIRISLDEAIIQDIIDRPDVPELIRTSPLTRREWQVLSLIHAGLSNDQIAEHMKVAPTTVKTHIRSLYQKQNITHRSEAINLARDLLSKIQGE